MRKTLADAAFRRLWRAPLDTLEDMLFRDVLLAQDFTTLGAARFVQDVSAIQNIIESSYGHRTQGRLNVPKLADASALLNLPLEAEQGLDLKTTRDRIFGSSQQASEVLVELGLNHLTIGEARMVLSKRVEINSE